MIEIISDFFKNFSFSSFLDLIKFLSTLGIAVWGVYHYRRSKFYYIQKDKIQLYNDIVKKVKGISIKYKDEDVNTSLIVLSGTIILKTHADVKKDEIDQELTIFSPDENAIWRNFEITKTSIDFEPNFKIDKNKVIIEKSMLKAEDYISFSGLLDSNNAKLLIRHRIYNIIPRSINFIESDISFYRHIAIVATLYFLTFILSLLYINHTNKNLISEINSLEKHSYFLDFDKTFYLRDKKVNIDSFQYQFEIKMSNDLNKSIDVYERKYDSLMKIYNAKPNFENENILLRYHLAQTQNLKLLNNPYEIINDSSNHILKKLLKSKKLNESKKYILNDSIQVQYINYLDKINDELIQEKAKQPKDLKSYFDLFFNFFGYLFFLFLIYIIIYYYYKYYVLIKLKKIYGK